MTWCPSLRLVWTYPTMGATRLRCGLGMTRSLRPLFCDLLAPAPLNLERIVSLESGRAFKLVTLEEVAAIAAELTGCSG